jgi:hypothetical protein
VRMRYQVPQYIDVEDKIIGPFTLKQFLIYVVAVMVLVPVYLFSELALFIALALPVIGVAAAFAHVKINGKSLAATIANAIQFYLQGQLYIWRRTATPKPLKINDPEWHELTEGRAAAKEELTSLAKVSQSLETQGHVVASEDIEDTMDIEAQSQQA